LTPRVDRATLASVLKSLPAYLLGAALVVSGCGLAPAVVASLVAGALGTVAAGVAALPLIEASATPTATPAATPTPVAPASVPVSK